MVYDNEMKDRVEQLKSRIQELEQQLAEISIIKTDMGVINGDWCAHMVSRVKELEQQRDAYCAAYLNTKDENAKLAEALKPFAEAAKEVRPVAGIPPENQWVWKPQSTSKVCAGVNAQMLFAAAAALKEAKGGQESN